MSKPSQAVAAALAPQRTVATLKYRPDIDGLRAVAVLSVLFFHVGWRTFGGGWVGVDVFFVISGYLITRLIMDEIAAGTFSFAGFYARRARRLFAAFIFTVALTFVGAALIFDRVYLQHFAGEVVYALVAASNFFYWLDGGYFGVAEQYKPLLHTWSLGVEEQFYLLWPLSIMLLLRYLRRYFWLVLAAAGVLSLFLAEYYFYLGKERAAFLLLPSRIFEFAIGALLCGVVRRPLPEVVRVAALLAGVGLIVYAVLDFTITTPFPTLYALVPCGGAALAILGGTSKTFGWLLGNRPMVGIGKISYSLYLIHWPVIVFYSYHRLAPLSQSEQALICVVTIAAAALMYRYIEQPFRNPQRVKFASRTALALTCTAAVTVLLLPASIVWAKGTLFWRGSTQEVTLAQLQQTEELHRQDEVDELLRDRGFAAQGARTRLMFVGDSHSGDVAAALFLTLGTTRYDYARSGFAPNCFSAIDRRPWILRLAHAEGLCGAQLAALKNDPSLASADYLFIADRWSTETLRGFTEGLAFLRSLTHAKMVVVGQNATFPTFDDSLRYLDRPQLLRLNRVLYQQQSAIDVEINRKLRTLARDNGLSFIDRQSLVCSAADARCEVLSPDGRFLYSDSNHWSYAGRTVFGRRMAERFSDLVAGRSDPSTARQP